MFLVANTYEKGSQEFIDLFETAVKLYPDDVTANLNAAAAALSRKDTVYAKRYLSKIEKSLDIPNTTTQWEYWKCFAATMTKQHHT